VTAENESNLHQKENTPPIENFLFKDIVRQNRPCWYELSWEEEKPAIILRIHNDFIRNPKVTALQRLNEDIKEDLMREFCFTGFSGNFETNIGFEQVFKRRGEKGNFTKYVIEIPNTSEDIHEWRKVSAISASFTFFTRLLYHCENDTFASQSQLMTVQTITERGIGAPLGGKISIPLRQWLSSMKGENTIPEMVKAMKTTYGRMCGLKTVKSLSHEFNVVIQDAGALFTECPGIACGIDCNPLYMQEKEGYEFSCHNVDSSTQQLTLLAGLAALHDQARKEIKT